LPGAAAEERQNRHAGGNWPTGRSRRGGGRRRQHARRGRTLARYDIKVIGINRGNLGFLTDLDPDNAQQQLADVLEGHYISEKRFLLEAQVCQQDCQKRISTAINEVVLHPGKVAHMIEFEVYIDDLCLLPAF
jgi:NAD kinase